MKNGNENITRRNFFKKIWIGLGIVAGLEFIYLIFSFFNPKRKKNVSVEPLFEAGTIGSFKKNSITPFRSQGFFLTRLENGEFMALSTRCTHLGCALEYDESKNLLVCPCHSSMFDIKGKVLKAPATRDLDQLEVVIENNNIKVNPRDIINSKRRNKGV
ncbi:MAG: Rieske (2Fe-2S) protein [Bacteroidota bacterium]